VSFVGLARQNADALGIHRQRAAEREIFLARLERLQVGDEYLVGHDRGRAQHLGAADRDAGRILVDDARHEILGLLAPAFGALGLRVDDHVGQEQVVLRRVIDIGLESLGAFLAVFTENLDAHALSDQRRGQMVGRTAEETAG
jgi:hypothetical protein